jgi:dTDP-4-dehydrorhamnose reductase
MPATPPRFAVLGSAGQLGRDLCSRLSGRVTPLTRADANLTDRVALRAKLTEVGPNAVINCAAYNFVDRAEDEPENAFAVNAFAVRRFAEICRDLDAVLVHFSTDYVFGLDAARRTPYSETDAPGPISVYGASKLAGENLVRAICPKHLIIRTCGLYGRWGSGGKGGNFVETMLRFAGQGKPLRVVDDQICTPTYTVDLAETAVHLLEAGAAGLYHGTNSGECSWHEFARTIFEIAGIKADLAPITSAQFGAKAKRPSYSVLTSERKETPKLRPWREAIAAYLRERSA